MLLLGRVKGTGLMNAFESFWFRSDRNNGHVSTPLCLQKQDQIIATCDYGRCDHGTIAMTCDCCHRPPNSEVLQLSMLRASRVQTPNK